MKEPQQKGGLMAGTTHLVKVVFDLESRDEPTPIGTFSKAEEDIIFYVDPHNAYRAAPQDCVAVVEVEVTL